MVIHVQVIGRHHIQEDAMRTPIRRGRATALIAAALAVLGSAAAISGGTALAGTADVVAQSYALRWSADPATDGLNAFVGIEDDRSNSHPGVKHIFAESTQYRFVMHKQDRDGSDRQR